MVSVCESTVKSTLVSVFIFVILGLYLSAVLTNACTSLLDTPINVYEC